MCAADNNQEDSAATEFRLALIDTLPALRAYAIALTHNRNRADDLTQETVIRALSAWQQFEPGTNFKAWIFKILRNEHVTYFRKKWTKNVSIEDLPESIHRTHPNQEVRLELAELNSALQRLPIVQREALLLVVVQGFKYEEAAEVCGCAVGTIKSRVSRARQALYELLIGSASDQSVNARDNSGSLQDPLRARRLTRHAPLNSADPHIDGG